MTGRIVYLVRHEEAEVASDGPDGHRALTSHGRQRAHATGHRFAALGERIDLVLTSPLVRAVQTAEILAGALTFAGTIQARNRIAEPSSLDDLRALLDDVPVPGALIVGHEPTLSAFAAFLLGLPRLSRGFSCGTIFSLQLSPKGTPCVFRYALSPDASEPIRVLV